MMGNMMQNGMQGMMTCAGSGWLMMGTHVVVLAVVLLAGAALVKYLFFTPRNKGAILQREAFRVRNAHCDQEVQP
jgi:hypothetical protein